MTSRNGGVKVICSLKSKLLIRYDKVWHFNHLI